ncbi:MAG: hypothetical protein HYV28_20130 [Ignavibacteriales bacterium]|nr:hypothetical protein [Ignavibacteriales bacterium]
MKILLYFLGCCLVLVWGCCSAKIELTHPGADSALRRKINLLLDEKSDDKIDVLVQCSKTIDAAVEKEIIASGVEKGSVMGDIISVNGTARQIVELSKISCVKQMELAQERKPINK